MTTLNPLRPANGVAALARGVGFVLAANLFLALTGPFGTMLTMDLPARSAHWAVSGLGIGAFTWAGAALAQRCYGAKPAPLWMFALVALCAAMPGAFIVQACLRIWSPDSLRFVQLHDLFANVALINVPLTVLSGAAWRWRTAPHDEMREASAEAASAFMQRLPPRFRGATLIAIGAEDHYLRVQTNLGDALLHMRMSEAEALLAKADGLRVHRSHWVARAAVANITRKRGQTTIKLANGRTAPVSRSRLEALAKAGWPMERG